MYKTGQVFKIRGTHDYLIVRNVRKRYFVFGEVIYSLENVNNGRTTKPMTVNVMHEFLEPVYDPKEFRRARLMSTQRATSNYRPSVPINVEKMEETLAEYEKHS